MVAEGSAPIEILLVEDNPGDVRLTEEALKDSGVDHNLTVARDGEVALAMLKKEGDHSNAPHPSMILLDLGLPKMDGRELLTKIKEDPDLKNIPVVVLTMSSSEEDILRSYNLQVNNYLTKPLQGGHLKMVIGTVQNYLRAIAKIQRSPGD